MKRKPGMTMDEFKAYYEDHHVPLINRLLPHATDYRRNFVEPAQHAAGHMAEGRSSDHLFDVMTELTYPSEEMYQKTLDALADPETGGIIAADEAKFFDRLSMRSFRVDKRQTSC